MKAYNLVLGRFFEASVSVTLYECPWHPYIESLPISDSSPSLVRRTRVSAINHVSGPKQCALQTLVTLFPESHVHSLHCNMSMHLRF